MSQIDFVMNRVFSFLFLVLGSMTDAPRTDASATVAPHRHLLSRFKSSLNQNQNSPSVSLPLSPSPSFTPSPSSTLSSLLILAPTPSTIRKASVVGEQVSREQHSCYHFFFFVARLL